MVVERFKLLSDAELLRIDQASRALLWEVGLVVENEEAKEYFEKAASVGNPFACYQLAKLILSDEKHPSPLNLSTWPLPVNLKLTFPPNLSRN